MNAKALGGVSVDQELLLGDALGVLRSDRIRRVTVKKVGRTLVHVADYGHLRAFRMETGFENSDPATDRLYTEEQWQDALRRHSLVQRLQRAGVSLGGAANRASTGALERIVEILNQDLGADTA